MNTIIAAATQLELMPGMAQAPDGVIAELNSASSFEALQVRESTITLVLENILQFRPSHWEPTNERWSRA